MPPNKSRYKDPYLAYSFSEEKRKELYKSYRDELQGLQFVGICTVRRYIPEVKSYREMIKLNENQDGFIIILKGMRFLLEMGFSLPNKRWVGFGEGDGRILYINLPGLKFGEYLFEVDYLVFNEREIIMKVLICDCISNKRRNGLLAEKITKQSLGNTANMEINSIVPTSKETEMKNNSPAPVDYEKSVNNNFNYLPSSSFLQTIYPNAKTFIVISGNILLQTIFSTSNVLHTFWHVLRGYNASTRICKRSLCIFCKFKFEYKRIVKSHSNQVRPNLIKCYFCRYQTKNEIAMKNHIKQKHTSNNNNIVREPKCFNNNNNNCKNFRQHGNWNDKNHYKNSDKMKTRQLP